MNKENDKNEVKGSHVIDRAFDILEILSFEKGGLGVTDIGQRAGLHKSTVHRILNAMANRGYIEKNKEFGTYRIGLKIVELSSVYLNRVELKTEARPYLWALTNSLNLTTHLAIVDGNDAVYIDKVDVMNSIRLYSQIGKRIPIHSSALGKSLLSGLTHNELEERLMQYPFEIYTKNTIKNKESFIQQILKANETGWSMDNEEHEEGVICIAAPIKDYREHVVAAVSVTGSVTRIEALPIDEIVSDIKKTAMCISMRLGYKG